MNFKTRLAVNVLNSGGVVSLPTDTIQGLSCLPLNTSLQRLAKLKQRSSKKGFILISNNIHHFEAYVNDLNLLKKNKAY